MHHKKPGDRVGRYLIEALLGVGSMGEVYEARDTLLGRRVALKVLRRDERDGRDGRDEGSKRLLREAQAAAALDHPNAVVIYDVGEELGEMVIAMELVRGKSLRDAASDPGVSVGRKLRWLADAARAIGAAHRAGLIHRDVKPADILVRDDGVTKVIDFGVALRDDASSEDSADGARDPSPISANDLIVGHPRYVAPEQLRGAAIDARTNQFAWAVTAYELLAGEPPWDGPAIGELSSQILTSDPAPLRERASEIPAEVERSILRALAKRPDDRFPSIDHAADAIEPFADAPVVLSRGAPPGQRGGLETPALPGQRATSSDASGMTREADSVRSTGETSRKPRAKGRRIAAALALTLAAGGLAIGAGLLRSQTPEPAAQTESTAPPIVRSLACEEATLKGSGALPEIADAIGVGTCARLAVELGIDWSVTGSGERAAVEATLEGGGAAIEISVANTKAVGRGATPREAMTEAAASLATKLAAPPMTPAEIAAWGVKDEASARRMERALRQIELDFTKDELATARALMDAYPGSAIAVHIAQAVELGGPEKKLEHAARIAELAESLSPGRSKVVRSRIAFMNRDRSEALRLARQAYAESPDDAWLASHYALLVISMGAAEEGFAVLERLHARSPSRSVWGLHQTFIDHPLREADRERKYIDSIRAILPESAAWSASIRHDVLAGNIDEARRKIALGLNLGAMGTRGGSNHAEQARAWVELSAFEPKAAREIGTKLLAEPQVSFAQMGADILIASYLLEGRVDDATAVQAREIERYIGETPDRRSLNVAMVDLRQRRLLGRPPPDEARMAWFEAEIKALEGGGPGKAVAYRVEIAFAKAAREREPKKAKVILERALTELEAQIKADTTLSPDQRDTTLVKTVPLVRAARGDEAAAKRWSECARASDGARALAALDAGLALQASGNLEEAEKAYLTAQSPATMDFLTLPVIAARFKLAELYRSEGRIEAAAKLDGVFELLWASADPDVRKALSDLR